MLIQLRMERSKKKKSQKVLGLADVDDQASTISNGGDTLATLTCGMNQSGTPARFFAGKCSQRGMVAQERRHANEDVNLTIPF